MKAEWRQHNGKGFDLWLVTAAKVIISGSGTSRTSDDVRLKSAKCAKADIYQITLTIRDL
jgi:hypothetical protein